MNHQEREELNNFFALLNTYESTTERKQQLSEASRVTNYMLAQKFHFLDIKEIKIAQKKVLNLLLAELSNVEVEIPDNLFDNFLLQSCKYLARCKRAERDALPVLPLHMISPKQKFKKFRKSKSLRIHVQRKSLLINNN